MCHAIITTVAVRREESERMQREGLTTRRRDGDAHSRPRVLVFIVAYNAEKTISQVVRRIPKNLAETYDLEVLIIDDASRDATFAESHSASKAGLLPCPV